MRTVGGLISVNSGLIHCGRGVIGSTSACGAESTDSSSVGHLNVM